MERRRFLGGIAKLGLLGALTPTSLAAFAPKPEQGLKRTGWLGKDAYELPDVHIKSIHPNHLAKAWDSFLVYDYSIESMWFYKWDLQPLLDIQWSHIVDRETHREFHEVGIQGYMWGSCLRQSIDIPPGTFYMVSDDYSGEAGRRWPRLIQRVTFTERLAV
jgi:hypothetical protein